MKNILLTISYDGTDFCGWQRQDANGVKNVRRTVQGELECAIEKLVGFETPLCGSGRTDSGVHAEGQAAHFFSPIDSFPVKNYIRALNAILPRDIRIVNAEERPMHFNARFNATSRVYRYFMYVGEDADALINRFAWCIHFCPNIDALNEMAAFLKGEMDFDAFSASGDKSPSKKRYIERAQFFYERFFPSGKEALVFEIEANAFLWKMVRSITGTLMNLARVNAAPSVFKKVLDGKNHKDAGPTAPPTGLFLYKVNFDGIRRH